MRAEIPHVTFPKFTMSLIFLMMHEVLRLHYWSQRPARCRICGIIFCSRCSWQMPALWEWLGRTCVTMGEPQRNYLALASALNEIFFPSVGCMNFYCGLGEIWRDSEKRNYCVNLMKSDKDTCWLYRTSQKKKEKHLLYFLVQPKKISYLVAFKFWVNSI